MLKNILSQKLGKYKGIIVSILLFLLLDISVLVMNFYISFKIADDASAVNLAGRQRMLSQRMTKVLFDIQYSLDSEEELSLAMNELTMTSHLFDSTLTAFSEGGFVIGADSKKVYIEPVSDSIARKAIFETQRIWNTYKKNISDLVKDNQADSIDFNLLSKAILFAKENNLTVLDNMNTLTVKLEEMASKKATDLRTIQMIGMLFAILNFFLIIFHFLKQLRQSDDQIEKSRKETSRILETVNEGLFLVNRNLELGSEYSQELEEIIGSNDIAGRKFNDLLHAIVTKKSLKAAEGFIDILFNPKIKSKLITDLNPLDQVQVNIENRKGNYTTKYLAFDFSRVINEGVIVNILVSVRDITKTVLLTEEVERLKEQENEQLEMLTSILHTNSDLIKEFISKSFTTFNQINERLKIPTKSSSEHLQKIDILFRQIHNFKGEASSLRLEKFALMAHEFEDMLVALKGTPNVSGNDFLTLTLLLDKLISYTQSVDALMEKLADFNHETDNSIQSITVNTYLYDFLNDLCLKTNKRANLFCSGLYENNLDKETQQLIQEITIQFMRNAMVHGIESPTDRMQSQKNVEARIDCHLSRLSNGMMELVFEDDGGGINYDAIREKAIASGQWSESDIDTWDNKKILSLIFTPGFSTLDQANDIAGRGVGMDVIKEKINYAKGKLQILTRKGRGTKFTVTLPESINQLNIA